MKSFNVKYTFTINKLALKSKDVFYETAFQIKKYHSSQQIISSFWKKTILSELTLA